MRTSFLNLALILVGLTLGARSMSESTEQMIIEKQVPLSPGHHVMPYHIVRASNGDLIVFGSTDQLDHSPWATRLTYSGSVRWEFLPGGKTGWLDNSQTGQRFDSAIEMPDQKVLLCGVKIVGNERRVLLTMIDGEGSQVMERVIRPDTDKGSIVFPFCIHWDNGIALIGSVSGSPAGTGWFAKLESNFNVEWQKFDDQYVSTSVMEAPEGGLFFINPFFQGPDSDNTSLVRFSKTGVILAHHEFSDRDAPVLVYPSSIRPNVKIVLRKDTLDTEVVTFDEHLQEPRRAIKLINAGVKKCLELPDGSIAIFGSQFHKTATAAVTRVYPNGTSKGFLVQPEYQSPWYVDAALTGNPYEFVAFRSVNYGDIVLDWVLFK